VIMRVKAGAKPFDPVASLLHGLLLATLLLPLVEPGKFKCPSFTKLTDDEFVYPDPQQCDKYWTCKRGESKRSLCPDGLVFHPDKGDGEDPCDLKHNVPDKCEGRSELQRAKPGDAHCPRQNGVYASEDPYECDTYYSCLNGKSSPTKCAKGLHYSDQIGTCVWPRESGRDDCVSADEEPTERKKKKSKGAAAKENTTRKPAEALDNGFQCPGGPIGVHPALPHPSDCRLYYVCLDGITPSDAGCTHGKVFNPTTQQCDIPINVEGCEYYYNPAAKKKKEEQEKNIASQVGADITSSDFNQFLKLLKMSGVLGGNSVSDAFASGIGPKGFRQGIRKGGGRRKRPKKLRQRPVRPIRPQYDYYDYDYAEYDALEAQPRPPPHASSPAKRPFNQRLRTSGSDREPDFPPLQSGDLTDTPRATPIRGAPKNVAPEPTEEISKQSLFAVPQSRKNKFTSRFIPKVKPVGNLENIHPTGFSQSAEGSVKPSVKNPVQPVKKVTVPQLSGKEADALFNSLFPDLKEEPSEPLPAPQPIVAVEPVIAEIITTQRSIKEKNEESPRRSLIASPLTRSRNRNSLFNRRPFKTETTAILTTVKTTMQPEETILTATTEKITGNVGRTTNVGRKSLFSTRNRLRSRPSIMRKSEETLTTEPVTTAEVKTVEVEDVTVKKPDFPILRQRHRFPFTQTSPPVIEDITESNIINTDGLDDESFTTARSLLKQSPRKSFRSLLKSRSQNRLPISVPKLHKKDKRPTLLSTTPAKPVHLPDPVPELVTESPVVKQIPTSQPNIPLNEKIEILPTVSEKTRKFSPVFIEPAFLKPVQSVEVTASPFTQLTDTALKSGAVISSSSEDSVRSLSRTRARSKPVLNQDQFSRSRPTPEPKRFPKGRSSFVSAPLDNIADHQRQRIIAHKVRKQIKDYLPEAENEGDAIEKLRAKIERNQNRNRARG